MKLSKYLWIILGVSPLALYALTMFLPIYYYPLYVDGSAVMPYYGYTLYQSIFENIFIKGIYDFYDIMLFIGGVFIVLGTIIFFIFSFSKKLDLFGYLGLLFSLVSQFGLYIFALTQVGNILISIYIVLLVYNIFVGLFVGYNILKN